MELSDREDDRPTAITVEDGVWVLDLGEVEDPAQPPAAASVELLTARRRGRGGPPIMAYDAKVPDVPVDARGGLFAQPSFDGEAVKEEALSWLKALTHAA